MMHSSKKTSLIRLNNKTIYFFLVCLFIASEDNRRGSSGESGGVAMPRLPSCCPQHSPCSGPPSGHLSLNHPHSGCMQAGQAQQHGPPQPGSQHSHGHSHHFHHHHHHHAGTVPSSLPFPEPSCPLERTGVMPVPCAGVSASTQYHDQVQQIIFQTNLFAAYMAQQNFGPLPLQN